MSLIKVALNLNTFGPPQAGQMVPINPLSARRKPILNRTKMKPNETLDDIGMRDNKQKEIVDTLRNMNYSENYWEHD